MNMLFTSDIAKVRYVTSTSFSRFVKGPEWRKRFHIFGEESIFNADLEEWKQQRKIIPGFLSHQELQEHLTKIKWYIIWYKIKFELANIAQISWKPHFILVE